MFTFRIPDFFSTLRRRRRRKNRYTVKQHDPIVDDSHVFDTIESGEGNRSTTQNQPSDNEQYDFYSSKYSPEVIDRIKQASSISTDLVSNSQPRDCSGSRDNSSYSSSDDYGSSSYSSSSSSDSGSSGGGGID